MLLVGIMLVVIMQKFRIKRSCGYCSKPFGCCWYICYGSRSSSGVGAILATGVAVGAIWTMYFRIAKYLNLHMGKGTWKAIASAVLTNIVTQLAGILALELAVGFIREQAF